MSPGDIPPACPGADELDHRTVAWLDALERRHLADLTFSEVARALRALSSCYVERRSRLAAGGALEGRGKRAAFALFYGPLHFLVTRRIVRELTLAADAPLERIVDLGCGTGAAGAAWALEAGVRRISGFDRNPWAVTEAAWTYRTLGIAGRAVQADAARTPIRAADGDGLLLAYVLNELPDESRAALRTRLLGGSARGRRVLVIEPIARRVAPWWSAWEDAFANAGGRSDEWRFPAELPPLQRNLARAAGLDPRGLTARTLAL
jgi:SAM-dependent methyltransferase